MLIALGTGLAPHLSKAVLEGVQHMAGEFVRTPKHGVQKGRYRARADLPLLETALALLSFAAVIASVETGHYFATPFATLFTVGYGYVALLIAHEQAARRREAAALAAARTERAWASEPPRSDPAPEAATAPDLAA
jgi:hypothetical protein